MTPTISNLRLAPFTEAHITPQYLGWLNDKSLMRYSRQRLHAHTRESSLAFLATFRGSPNFFWAVEQAPDALLAGTLTASVDPQHGTADLGILIGLAGQGHGKAAWGLALRHGFETLGLRKITGGSSAKNRAMIAIFEHWRMHLEARQREQELYEDGPADLLFYGQLRAEWSARAL